MQNTVYKVETTIKIVFPNLHEEYILPTQTSEFDDSLINYCTGIHLKEALYTRNSKDIVGNIVGNTLSVSLVSKDGLLLPLNERSRFYGHMNDTAYIDITCAVDDDNPVHTINMGRYYVDTWEGGASAGTSNEVSISAVDLMSRVKNISLRRMHIDNNINIDQFIDNLRVLLNSNLPSYMQIGKESASYGIFKDYPYPWQMYFNSIDLDNIEVIFNRIANNTISYLWINRRNALHADPLLNKQDNINVLWELNGTKNLLNYGTQTGDIGKYSGVRVNYTQSVSHSNKELLKMSDVQLYKNDDFADFDPPQNKYLNLFEDIKLNDSNVFDIHTIEVECEDGIAYTREIYWYKDSVSFYIISDTATKATITVYGDVIEENINTIEKYKDDNDKNYIVEIDNKLLRSELIPTYVDGLINIMSMKNSQIYAEGFINPRMELGDYVEVIGSSMNLQGIYKVISIDMTLGTNYRSKVGLIKIIETERSYEDILAVHNGLLLEAMSGVNVQPSEYPDITSEENQICLNNYYLYTAITNLQHVIDQYTPNS